MDIDISPEEITKFHSILFDWWAGDNRRKLPWREAENPYYVMVSEFMLQQTQVTRVVPKYEKFITTYPKLEDLADASKSDVIELWQGLGYNRRAIWLQEAATTINDLSEFPRNRKELQKIKGIGPYSSRSIPIFAFNVDYAAVDTNIRRILIHFEFADEEDKLIKLQKIADFLLPQGRSRDYHNAMMDYGATHLTASKTGIKSNNSQSTFANSDREIRGKIISVLVEKGKLSFEDLLEYVKTTTQLKSKKRLQEILYRLNADDMIIEKKNRFELPC